jgi:hypothetical protein
LFVRSDFRTCVQSPAVGDDDGRPATLLDGVSAGTSAGLIDARYRGRFTEGDWVALVTPDAVPAFSNAQVRTYITPPALLTLPQ